jgi:hypothetical protein
LDFTCAIVTGGIGFLVNLLIGLKNESSFHTRQVNHERNGDAFLISSALLARRHPLGGYTTGSMVLERYFIILPIPKNL